jgi:hypothetical protein
MDVVWVPFFCKKNGGYTCKKTWIAFGVWWIEECGSRSFLQNHGYNLSTKMDSHKNMDKGKKTKKRKSRECKKSKTHTHTHTPTIRFSFLFFFFDVSIYTFTKTAGIGCIHPPKMHTDAHTHPP